MSDTVGGAAALPTDTGTVIGAAAESAAPTGFLGEVEAWFADLGQHAWSLWKRGKAAMADIAAFNSDHPEVLAAAKALEAEAPPAVQAAIEQGLNVAQHLATTVANIEAHAADTGLPMAPVKPAA